MKKKVISLISCMVFATMLMFSGVFAAIQQTAQFNGTLKFSATAAKDNIAANVVLTTAGAVNDLNSTIQFAAGDSSQTKSADNLEAKIGANGIITFTITVKNTNEVGGKSIKAVLSGVPASGDNFVVSGVTESGTDSIAPGTSGTFTFTVTVEDMLTAIADTDFNLIVVLDAI